MNTTTRDMQVTSIMLDPMNPRIDPQEGQRATVKAMLDEMRDKIFALATDIVEKGGLDPTSRILVVEEAEGEIVVVEGNRRILALKMLLTPAVAADFLPKSWNQRLTRLSKQFMENPIHSVAVEFAESRDAADQWIELRHTGENKGAGMVGWGALEKARFDARKGEQAPELQVINLILAKGDLSAEAHKKAASSKRNLRITSMKRLLDNSYVRDRLGLSIDGKNVQILYPEEEVLRPLTRILDALLTGRLPVKHIYEESQQNEYIDGFSAEDLPDPSSRLEKPVDLQSKTTAAKPKRSIKPKPKPKKSRQKRVALIPQEVVLQIDAPRINEIYHELRDLPIEEFRNAVSVLFRVFVELSVDNFIAVKQLMTPPQLTGSRLGQKLSACARHLKTEGLMTEDQLAPLLKAARGDSHVLASSVTTFNQYVHNQHVSPTEGDLKVAWDDLCPFLSQIWS